ncbi:alkaline phosphatase-like isoform X5 [Anneissia japonica]|uniref:alkaline phosphatase-like isoform X1 n=1 Tax=Anneissia japonica TaxID=1529436 RepID=UPI0014257206|nr:alkaline phosphatase-like isoform X1 [Anneissia japonica]XP_033104634.1 alkaline phosphatase-like isoform X2 [Anneissia japonica]XP_033104635.1 alkaline phosphatase-like isoform X3 [Anneissia japonica]XP_033104636.1 alkaline phosphatase-like isoform X4 [Anneissia japonica]XP_033104637.1 alkaline phosphatase-like isoform X5 [Anneissia japonica]
MEMYQLIFTALLFSASLACVKPEEYAEYWNELAADELERALRAQVLNQNIAKNLVIIIGDGMGPATVSAGRVYVGQLDGNTGEEYQLSWEKFPHVALSKTYNTDAQVADSAGTACAFLSGVKTKAGVVGLDDHVIRGSCASTESAGVDSILHLSQRAGKSTGLVTTARVTHATPSAAYARCPERDWENDSDIPEEEAALGCKDIALQLVEDAPEIQVVMGGGRREMLPNTTADPQSSTRFGQRTDKRNLIEEWVALRPEGRTQYVYDKGGLDSVDVDKTDYLLGLFDSSHMDYESERDTTTNGDPSLVEMTEKALQILQKNEKGYFLLVEAGRIDHAHHGGRAFDALSELKQMHLAVAKVVEMTSEEDTLIIVTADHSHTLSFGGYPERGNPILGLVDDALGKDRLPYTTLAYANGPGGLKVSESYNATNLRPNNTGVDTEDRDYKQDALVPLSSETHGGEDVAIYATGPMAHLFHGVHEQNYIMHVMKYAACVGDNKEHCEIVGNSAIIVYPTFLSLITSIYIILIKRFL